MKDNLINIALKFIKNTDSIQQNTAKIYSYLNEKEQVEDLEIPDEQKKENRWKVSSISKGIGKVQKIFKKQSSKDLRDDHPVVQQATNKIGEYLGISAGTATALVKTGMKLKPIIQNVIRQRQGFQAIPQTEALVGESLGAETLGVLETESLVAAEGIAEGATVLSGLGVAGEVATTILAPEIIIPAMGIGMAIKELYEVFDDIF